MKYTPREGIIYRMIVNEHFLLALGDAAKVCPAIQQINKDAVFYWKMLEKGINTEQILEAASIESGLDKEKLRPGFDRFINALVERQYVICEDESQE